MASQSENASTDEWTTSIHNARGNYFLLQVVLVTGADLFTSSSSRVSSALLSDSLHAIFNRFCLLSKQAPSRHMLTYDTIRYKMLF